MKTQIKLLFSIITLAALSFSCETKDQSDWETKIIGSAEFSEIVLLRQNISSSRLNNFDQMFDKLLAGKSHSETVTIIGKYKKDILEVAKTFDFSAEGENENLSRLEGVKKSSQIVIDAFNNSSLPEEIKLTFIKNFTENADKEIKLVQLEEAMLKKYPELKNDPSHILLLEKKALKNLSATL